MPLLKWDETDFLDCLEVFPTIDDAEHQFEFRYEVLREGLVLEISVERWESLVKFSLRQEQFNAPITQFAVRVDGEVTFHPESSGNYLHFSQCLLLPREKSYSRPTLFDYETFNLKLFVKPHIRFETEF